jgi:hypothetical protein
MAKKRWVFGNAQPLAVVSGAAALLALLAVTGCSAPAVEGYQIQAPPEGFLYVVNQTPGAGILAPRQVVSQGMWVGDFKMDEPRSILYVTRYRGVATESEAAAVRDARVARVGPYNTIRPLRTQALPDGSGTAWSWTEERYDEQRRLRSLQVSRVLSLDTVSFSLVFDTDVPERMTEAHLEAVLATFALGRTVVHWRAIWGAAGLLAMLAGFLGLRARRGTHTAYRLWDREETPKSRPSESPGTSDPRGPTTRDPGHRDPGDPS